jgi:hypothetical protein
MRGQVIAAASLLAAIQIAGCSGENPFLSDGPSPRVEDCMLLSQSTPAKYVCDGKTYTSVQLNDIRNGKTDGTK